jgi:serine/threonine protein kinase
VIAGPHKGRAFRFARHDTFLVGRSVHAHFQLPDKDKYFSRVHFMVEVNPPQCRLIDMGSHNGTYVNGSRVFSADLQDGDEIRAGHTILKLSVHVKKGEAEWAVAPTGKRALVPVISGYKLTRGLGRGGMGTVYLATRLVDKARVAVKAIAPKVACSKAEIDHFLSEARALQGLEHPHIARIRESGWTGSVLYVVMEYAPGPSAAGILAKDGPFEIRRGVAVVVQMLEALAYAHQREQVHRDIKPANILLASVAGKEVSKLADFGLARIYQASRLSGVTMTVDAGGSAAYLAPERITHYQAAEPAADQYAAAATLYTMLTGKHVLDLPAEIHRQFSLILKAQPVPIRQRRLDVSPALASVIHKALARDPARRFENVGLFRAALVKALGPGV